MVPVCRLTRDLTVEKALQHLAGKEVFLTIASADAERDAAQSEKMRSRVGDRVRSARSQGRDRDAHRRDRSNTTKSSGAGRHGRCVRARVNGIKVERCAHRFYASSLFALQSFWL
eukprot:6200350-Pleurochrysis_carterae.AAC.2